MEVNTENNRRRLELRRAGHSTRPRRAGRRRRGSSHARYYRRACAYDVRHGVATAMSARRVDTQIASAVLRHSSADFTADQYQHVLRGMTAPRRTPSTRPSAADSGSLASRLHQKALSCRFGH